MTIKITIETDSWDSIPEDLRVALEKAGTGTVSVSEPASAPLPHQDIIDALMADISTREVTQEFIIPLLRKWPQTRGEPKHVLSRLATDLRFNSKRELEFAREFLMKGKHEFMPDLHEVFAAIGRQKLHQSQAQRLHQAHAEMKAMDEKAAPLLGEKVQAA
jgi:hypothetical protein